MEAKAMKLTELRIEVGPASPAGGNRQRDEWRAALKALKPWINTQKPWSGVRIDDKMREIGRGDSRDYHDRVIIAETPQIGNAKAKKVILELTGGIDIVMDARETTRVFVCKKNSDQ
jgi:hypothetical protein